MSSDSPEMASPEANALRIVARESGRKTGWPVGIFRIDGRVLCIEPQVLDSYKQRYRREWLGTMTADDTAQEYDEILGNSTAPTGR